MWSIWTLGDSIAQPSLPFFLLGKQISMEQAYCMFSIVENVVLFAQTYFEVVFQQAVHDSLLSRGHNPERSPIMTLCVRISEQQTTNRTEERQSVVPLRIGTEIRSTGIVSVIFAVRLSYTKERIICDSSDYRLNSDLSAFVAERGVAAVGGAYEANVTPMRISSVWRAVPSTATSSLRLGLTRALSEIDLRREQRQDQRSDVTLCFGGAGCAEFSSTR
uniref:Uncharacterized protein n=1 Tax=Angiostrongylus cantonensis TaxID=6313 RepID=A0A0K0DL62_ANGCA